MTSPTQTVEPVRSPVDLRTPRVLSPAEILEAIPQQPPFRFVEQILSIDDREVVATHRFTGDESFYPGHFPGNPVTPGVILVETMAQCALVPHAIYHFAKRGTDARPLLQLFLEADVEFRRIVRPGTRVLVRGEIERARHRKLRSRVELRIDDDVVACTGVLTGLCVPQSDGLVRPQWPRRRES